MKNQDQYAQALLDHQSGKPLKTILSENPNLKRSSFYSFLMEQCPDAFQTDKAAAVGQLFSSSDPREHLVDNLLGQADLFHPDQLLQPERKPQIEPAIKGKQLLGHGKSWWLNPMKAKKPKTQEQQQDEQQMITVQKIRLYLMHFPQLAHLHIIPKKKTKGHEGEPDVEKFLIGLYSKKQAELDKMLDFIQFAVRNQINEQTSVKMANNIVTTGSKVIEHVLVALGLKVQGLTSSLMEDEDVTRCIREILIENSINTMSFGPKADLGIKLVMKIVQTDSQNRIQDTVQRRAQEQAKQQQDKQEAPAPIPDKLADKYEDL
eukprot:m.36226 g.36226  ORF g.36226 m.36226 type:complete len:319 (+) comp12461_c0_seq6:74-1030(+)